MLIVVVVAVSWGDTQCQLTQWVHSRCEMITSCTNILLNCARLRHWSWGNGDWSREGGRTNIRVRYQAGHSFWRADCSVFQDAFTEVGESLPSYTVHVLRGEGEFTCWLPTPMGPDALHEASMSPDFWTACAWMPYESWDITCLSGIKESPEYETKVGGMMWGEGLLELMCEQQD